MANYAKTITSHGIANHTVTVECYLANGLPSISLVGLPHKSIAESKERLRGAFAANHLQLPRKRVIINLAPADIPKSGTSFDLAIAVSILIASGQLPLNLTGHEAFFGELSLDGQLRAVRGIVGKLLAGKRAGLTTFYIPVGNLEQAQLVPHITLLPVSGLNSLYAHAHQLEALTIHKTGPGTRPRFKPPAPIVDTSEISGQAPAKRAIEIAVAGGHNILLSGPPGTGKTFLAKAAAALLPQLEHEEMLELTHLYSLVAADYAAIISQRPFRSPHHTASLAIIIGRNAGNIPGEINLAHNGVLFLDELPEFKRPVIESLRQPLEARSLNGQPANFILVATANPCPCGFYGSAKACNCLPYQVQQYQRKLSGPIIDRIDLFSEMSNIEHTTLLAANTSQEPTSQIRKRVIAARSVQAKRYGRAISLNAHATTMQLRQTALLEPTAKSLLDTASRQLGLSARGYIRCVRVARTIADLTSSREILAAHIAEALQFRSRLEAT